MVCFLVCTNQLALMDRFRILLLESKLELLQSVMAASSWALYNSPLQLLCSSKLKLGAASKKENPDKGLFTEVEGIVADAIGDILQIAANLKSGNLDKFDLVANLKYHIRNNNETTERTIQYNGPENLSIPSDLQVVLYFIILEAIKNVFYFTNPSEIWVEIEESGTAIKVMVTDNGVLPENYSRSNFKVANKQLESKVKLLGGTFDWQMCKNLLVQIKTE